MINPYSYRRSGELKYRALEINDFSKVHIDLLGEEICGFDSEGNLREVWLTVDTEYLGYTFRANSMLYLYADGNISHGFLAKDAFFNSIRMTSEISYLPWIYFYENGQLARCTLAKDTSIQLGLFTFEFKEFTQIYFYENGTVNWGYQAYDTTLFGPYPFTVLKGLVKFHDDNSIAQCMVRESLVFNYEGNTYSTLANEVVQFHRFNSPAKTSIKNIQLLPGFKIGDYESVYPVGFEFYEGETLDEPGPLKSFLPPQNIEVNGFNVKSSRVVLHPNGSLKSFRLSSLTTIQGYDFPDNCGVHLYDNLKLERVWISSDTTIDGIAVCRNSVVTFDLDGVATVQRQTCP